MDGAFQCGSAAVHLKGLKAVAFRHDLVNAEHFADGLRAPRLLLAAGARWREFFSVMYSELKRPQEKERLQTQTTLAKNKNKKIENANVSSNVQPANAFLSFLLFWISGGLFKSNGAHVLHIYSIFII